MALAMLLLLTTTRDAAALASEVGVGTSDLRVLVREPDPPACEGGVPRARGDLFTLACEMKIAEAGVDAAMPTLQNAIAEITPAIDAGRSAAIAGVDHELLPSPAPFGDGEGVIVYAMRRLPSLQPA